MKKKTILINIVLFLAICIIGYFLGTTLANKYYVENQTNYSINKEDNINENMEKNISLNDDYNEEDAVFELDETLIIGE